MPNFKGYLYNRYNNFVYHFFSSFGYCGLYYWSNRTNFGDLLGPDLFDYFGIPYIYAPPDLADAASVGSILDILPKSFSGSILGSGFIQDGPIVSFPNAHFYGVRGKISRNRIEDSNVRIIGDPGILVSDIYEYDKKSVYKLGIVPNYIDKQEEIIHDWNDRYPDNVKLVDPEQNPRRVIREISKCDLIVSSSLHGIVSAHSLGIPAARTSISGNVKGGRYKFKDYFSIYDTTLNEVDLQHSKTISSLKGNFWVPKRNRTENVKTRIRNCFLELRRK